MLVMARCAPNTSPSSKFQRVAKLADSDYAGQHAMRWWDDAACDDAACDDAACDDAWAATWPSVGPTVDDAADGDDAAPKHVAAILSDVPTGHGAAAN